jgi:hypothetical protein
MTIYIVDELATPHTISTALHMNSSASHMKIARCVRVALHRI